MALDEVRLPREALESWRSLELASPDAEPLERVLAWIARLQARTQVSGGRLARLLVATGLSEAESIVECLHAQIDAGPPGAGALGYDVESDLFAVGELASIESLDALSVRLADPSNPWAEWTASGVDELHVDLALRWLERGNEHEAELAADRIRWYRPLLRLLDERGRAMSPALRERLVERTGRQIASSGVASECLVAAYGELARRASDRGWLERARETAAMRSAERGLGRLEFESPLEDLAWALAGLGEFDEALACIADLDPADRPAAQIRLLRRAPDPARRAALVDAIFDAAETDELACAEMIEAAPEAITRVLSKLLAIADAPARFEALASVARYLPPDQAEPVCVWMLAHARSIERSASSWSQAWSEVLDALSESGCAALLDEPARRGLIDEQLGRADHELWHELVHFVPDDRLLAVLERSYAGLEVADHYVQREAWIALGLPLLERAPAALVERWLVLAGQALAGTGIDGASIERLAAWSPEQQRTIVMARLAQHQLQFLPRQLFGPWLDRLDRELPKCKVLRASEDPAEQSRSRTTLDRLLAEPGWPTHERVAWVLALLGRCSGLAALLAARQALMVGK